MNMKNCSECNRISELKHALEIERANSALLGEQRRRLIDDLMAENKALHALLDKQRHYECSHSNDR